MLAALPLLTAHADPPANDSFFKATQLGRHEVIQVPGDNREATRDPCNRGGEPALPGGSGRTVWWSWSPPTPGYAVVTAESDTVSPVVRVFTGKDVCTELVAQPARQASDGDQTSSFGFDASNRIEYRIAVDTRGQPGDFSLRIQLYTHPVITREPEDRSATEGTEARFSLEALGAHPLTYRWQFQAANAPGYVDLPNATQATLVLPNVEALRHDGSYRCVVTNRFTNIVDSIDIPVAGSVTSAPARLEVLTPPVITRAPTGGTANSCGNWTFNVDAAGGKPLHYQWQYRANPNDAWIVADSDDSLTAPLPLQDLRIIQSGQYRVRVWNLAGEVVSDPVSLQVNRTLPQIRTQPRTTMLGIEGEATNLVVAATGCGQLAYRWFYRPPGSAPADRIELRADTEGIYGFEEEQLAFDPVSPFHAGYYSVRITDEEGTLVFSSEALLTTEPRPPNDHFRNAIEIPPLASYTTNGFNKNGTIEPGEPNHRGQPPFRSVWWKYLNPTGGVATVSLGAETRFSSRLVIYKGPDLTALQPVAADTRSVRFAVEPDTWFYILVDGTALDQQGPIQLNLAFTVLGPCPELLSEPSGFTAVGDFRDAGGGCKDGYQLSGSAESITPKGFFWLFNGQRIPNVSEPLLRFPRISVEDSGAYQLVVTNAFCAVTSRVAQVQVTPLPLLLAQPQWEGTGNQPFALCSSARITIRTESCPDRTYQWRHNGQPLPGATQESLLLPVLNPALAGDYDVIVANRNGAVTSHLAQLRVQDTPAVKMQSGGRPLAENASLSLCADLAISIESPPCLDTLFQWRHEGQPIPDQTNATLRIPQLLPSDAGAYDALLLFGTTTVTSKVTHVRIETAPSITRQPQSLALHDCVDATFCVETAASPCAALTFQWFWQPEGAPTPNPLPNATNACLRLPNVNVASQGRYRVEISNGLRTVLSSEATLKVDAAPVITAQPARQRIRLGETFTNLIAATSCTAISETSFTWQRNGQPVVLDANHLRLASGSLVVRAATTADDGDYRCIVANAIARSTSAVVRIRIVTPPPNDHFAQRLPLQGTNLVATAYSDGANYHNELASREPNEPAHAGHLANRSVWWTWTAPTPGLVTLDLAGSRLIEPATGNPGAPLDTLLGVYLGPSVDRLTEWASDDNGGSSGASLLRFLAAKGKTFHFAVDGKSNAEGTLRLRLSEQEIIAPPTITNQPVSLAATNGETAVFSVGAEGSPDLLYQWTKNGDPIPGATGPSLVLTNVTKSDEANYRVVVSNDYPPAALSSIARLTFGAIMRGQVTDATNDKPIPDAEVCVGTNCVRTDLNGNYELVGVEPDDVQANFRALKTRVGLLEPVALYDESRANSVTLRCQKRPAYIDFEDYQFQPVRGRSVTNKISLSPVLTGMRFVLNWGRHPADLDLNLLVSTAETNLHWIKWDWAYGPLNRTDLEPYTTFDKDERNSFGPETLTVHRVAPGAYRLYVYRPPDGNETLPRSGATVRIYQHDATTGDNRHLGTVEVPTDESGDYWHVCDVDGFSGTVVWVNRLLLNPPVLAGPYLEPPSRTGSGPVLLPPSRTQPNPNAPDLTYRWSLGDGTIATTRDVTNHPYAKAGFYDVGLAVSRPRGTSILSNALVRPRFIEVTNGPPTIRFAWPPDQRIIRTRDPIDFLIAARDTDRLLPARKLTRVGLFRITAGITNSTPIRTFLPGDGDQLDPAGETTFATAFPETALEGTYTFVARAEDDQGAVTWSSPLRIQTRDLDGEILIVRNRPHPEIEGLEAILADMKVPPTYSREPGVEYQPPVVRVLDQEGLHFDLVRDFRLIIWDDTGRDETGITTNTVDVLDRAWLFGIPLYFIGENLASDTLRLVDSAARERWTALTHLEPTERTVPPGLIECGPAIRQELFLGSWCGTVENFEYPRPLLDSRMTGPNAEVRATRNGAATLVRSPHSESVDAFEPRRLTQTFLVTAGDDPSSLERRRDQFCNSVHWLLRNDCITFGITTACDPDCEVFAQPLEPIKLRTYASFGGECSAAGILITNCLPAEFGIIATNITFEPDDLPVLPRVEIRRQGSCIVFGFSRVRGGTRAVMEIDIVPPPCAGDFTNRLSTRVNFGLTPEVQQIIHVEGPEPCSSPGPSMDPLPLQFQLTTAGLVISLQPPANANPDPNLGTQWRLEGSRNLLSWSPVAGAFQRLTPQGPLQFRPVPAVPRVGSLDPAIIDPDRTRDFHGLARKLRDSSDAVSAYLRARLGANPRTALSAWDPAQSLPPALRQALAADLGSVLATPGLWDPERFAHTTLSHDTRAWTNAPPTSGPDLPRFHGLLLQDAYPFELSDHLFFRVNQGP